MNNIILVDASYTSFYRFFATIRWYSFAHAEEFKKYKNDPIYDWKLNQIFIDKYEKMYLDSIIKLIKKKIFDKSMVIFCMDSPREQLWRTELQNNYKKDRIDLSLKYNFKSTFEYTYNKIIPNLIDKYNNIYGLRVDKIEADDIIAIICMYLKDDKQNIYLISGDEDFLQLGRENLNFINYKTKKIFTLTEQEAKKALNNKIINGDISDCIPSIFPKGKKINKKEIINSEEKLMEYLSKNQLAKQQYELNKKMIDFNNIPKKYYNKVVKLFNNLL
jgi:5'-3' exonuclease